MHTFPARRCGTPASINVMQQIRRLIPTMPLRALSGVGNSEANGWPAVPPLPVAARQRLMDWGTAILWQRALNAADRLVPGITYLGGAYQTWLALSAAGRGHLVDALQHLPLSQLVPASVLEWLREGMANVLPEAVLACADHQDAVLALAACALLHELHAGPSALSDTRRDHPLARLIQGCRISLNVVRAIGNAPVPSTPNPRGLRQHIGAGADVVNASSTDAAVVSTALARSHGLARVADPHPMSYAQAPVPDAWPLPGAWARRGKSTATRGSSAGARGPKRPGGGVNKRVLTVRRTDPSERRNRLDVNARKDGPNQMRGVARANAIAAHGQAASAGAGADAGKESMMGPLTHSSSAVFKPKNAEDQRKAAAKIDPTVKPGKVAADGKAPLASVPVCCTAARADATTSDGSVTTEPDTERPAAIMLPRCLRFHGVREATRDVPLLARRGELSRHCVHRRAQALFLELFSASASRFQHAGGWTVTHPILEEMPKQLRTAQMFKIRHPQSKPGRPLPAKKPLGNDQVFSMMSVSLLENVPGADVSEQPSQQLGRNTFRLMEHVDLGGTRHLFIAYLRVLDQDRDGGIKAGAVDVNVGSTGVLSVFDERRDWTISANDLKSLVVGLEQTTGLRYEPAHEAELADATDSPPVVVERAENLLVAPEEILSWSPPHEALAYNEKLGFFNAVVVTIDGYEPLELYPNSFSIVGNDLIYVDGDLSKGTLRFGCPVTQEGARVLRCPVAADATFAQQYGLRPGFAYNLEALGQQLEDSGMIQLPTPRAKAADAGGGAGDGAEDDGSVSAPGSGGQSQPSSGQQLCAGAQAGSGTLPRQKPLMFRFNDGVLRYTDPHGRSGQLNFDRAPEKKLRYALGDTPDPEDADFARSIGIVRTGRYSQDDINYLFYGEGYVQE